jgi:hypothetical protein
VNHFSENGIVQGKLWLILVLFATIIGVNPLRALSQPVGEGTQGPLIEWSATIGDWAAGGDSGILQLFSTRLGFEELRQSVGLVWLRWDADQRSYTEVAMLDPIDLCGAEYFHSISLSFFSDESPEFSDIALDVLHLPPDPDTAYGARQSIFVEVNKLSREVRPLNCR